MALAKAAGHKSNGLNELMLMLPELDETDPINLLDDEQVREIYIYSILK